MKTTRKVKWKAIHLLTIWKMTKAGMTDRDLAKLLGVRRETLWAWRRDKPEVAAAVADAERERDESHTLLDWVWSRLSPDLRLLWNKINRIKRLDGIAQIEAILADHGDGVRQRLFLHALCVSDFSASAACAKVNVSKSTLDRWLRTDADFHRLVEEVEWHKANFYESSLAYLVRQGEPSATLFANKTFNAGRGYGQGSTRTLKVEHGGTVVHDHTDLEDLLPYLSEGAKLELLDAVRKREAAERKDPPTPVELLSHKIAESVS